MDRVIGWFTKKSTAGREKVAHLWVLSAKDHGQEVTACGKIGERGAARVDADVRDCGRCAEREARLQAPSHASH